MNADQKAILIRVYPRESAAKLLCVEIIAARELLFCAVRFDRVDDENIGTGGDVPRWNYY